MQSWLLGVGRAWFLLRIWLCWCLRACVLTWASDLKGFDDLERSSGLRWTIDLVIAQASLGTPGFPHAEWMSLCHPWAEDRMFQFGKMIANPALGCRWT